MDGATAQTNSPNADDPQHLDFVDSLRGIAILMVMAIHVSSVADTQSASLFLAVLLSRGIYGVQLFFVVSALTLFWSLRFRSAADRRPTAAFFVRRLCRIGPLFWVAIVYYTAFPPSHSEQYTPDGVGPGAIALTATFLHGWYPTTINAVVPGGWSIAAEAMFYLLVPTLFRVVRTLNAALVLASASTIAVGLLSPPTARWATAYFPAAWGGLPNAFVTFSFPSQVPVFAWGIALYFVLAGQRFEAMRTRLTTGGAAAIACVCLAVVAGILPRHLLCTLAFVGVAAALAARPWGAIVNRLTERLGLISYSMYIWHFAALDVASRVVVQMFGQAQPANSLAAATELAVVAGVTFAVTVPLAIASYLLIERPGIALGKAIIRSRGWGR